MKSPKPTAAPAEKSTLHVRNPHRFGYDFKSLIAHCAELTHFVAINKFNIETIDFANAEAVKTLNGALLKTYYDLEWWDIPQGYLVPPIPGRADYIHYAADLLATSNRGIVPTGHSIKVLDVGIGASAVYPIVGHKAYEWSFVGADTDQTALKSCEKIIQANAALEGAVLLRHQKASSNVLKGIILPEDEFDLVMCNPPFHASAEEAQEATARKWANLNVKTDAKSQLNFGGQNAELIYPGGEEIFVKRMISQSAQLPKNAYWYTCFLSKEDTVKPAISALKKMKALEIKTVKMQQGQKKSRFIAWTFLTDMEQRNWRERHWWNT